MRLGSIEMESNLGGYEMICAPTSSLPQDAATAVSAVNGGLLGATYLPLLYVGRQIVNGVNHLFIAREVRTTKKQRQEIVALVVNVPAGDDGEEARVINIIEEAELPAEVQNAFQSAISGIIGVEYKPLVYVGSQVVKGINHYVICSAQVIRPGAEPAAVLVGTNSFQGVSSIACVENLETVFAPAPVSAEALGCPLGEWP